MQAGGAPAGRGDGGRRKGRKGGEAVAVRERAEKEGEDGGEEEVRDLGLGLREGFFENCAGVGFVKKQQYRIFSSSCSNKI